MVRLSCAAALAALLSALASSAGSQTSSAYTYDVHGRLVGSTAGGAVTYTYDKAGNRVRLQVSNNNQAPTANSDTLAVAHNGTNTLDPRLNDSDPNSDPLTITGVSQGSPVRGTATVINSGQAIRYVANSGQSGLETLTYTISDGRGGAATSTIAVTIAAPAAGAPTAGAVTAIVPMNSSNNVIALTMTGSPTSVAVPSAPSHGSTAISGTTIRYTPHGNYHGADSFTYTATNASGASSPATVSLTVRPPAPVANVDTVSIPYGSAKTFQPLTNDTGTAITIVSVTQPSRGAMAHDLGNIWLGDFGTWSGTYSINYTIKDPYNQQSTSRVDVTVQPDPNPAPIARNDSVTVPYGSAALFQPMNNDSGTGIQITAATQPSTGRSAFDAGNIWVGDMGEGGFSRSFQYTIRDSQGRTASATVNVTAQANPNPAPIARNDSVIVPKNSAVLFQPLNNDSGNQITIISATTPPVGRVAHDLGNIWLGDMYGWTGTGSFQYTIRDNQGRTSTATVNFTSQ